MGCGDRLSEQIDSAGDTVYLDCVNMFKVGFDNNRLNLDKKIP